MGFATLLRFKMDRIPAKLAHYVVDKFNPEEMEIRVPCGAIKIDSEVIHQLLELPKDCHYQGCLREWILDYITEQTNFKDLDWCGLVVEKMKECKYNWKRCNVNSTFAGPLAILTVDPKVNPLKFLNASNLKERQKLEIKGGGFGIGPFKGLSSSTDIEGDEDTPLVDHMKYPEDEDILSLKAKYETMPEDKPMWHTITTEEIIIAKDQISSVLKGLNLEKGESSNNEQREEEDQETGDSESNNSTRLGVPNYEEKMTVAREADVEKEIEGNLQIGKSDKDYDNVIELPTKMCDEVTEDEGDKLGLERLGGKENKCAYEQTDNEWTEGLENIGEIEKLELDGTWESPCLSHLMELYAEGREEEASEESAVDQGLELTDTGAPSLIMINVKDMQTGNSGGAKTIGDKIYTMDKESGGKKENAKVKLAITNDESPSFSLRLTQMFASQRIVKKGVRSSLKLKQMLMNNQQLGLRR
ncbi:hypothetical protein L1987_27271 [Smallanthus sonchifolius]|uniref:Uncharacterized protein n=1 Tax=Smallanthus sonchifolius TaxID=185202 RepID=A0ACB9IC81_9ASTR|nr:hypothetical protein L1987_27271 [Smallanthus sonchifolius]